MISAQRRLLLGTLLGALPSRLPAALRSPVGAEERVVALGSSTVRLVLQGPADAAIVFINLHENESTSVLAARDVLGPQPAQRLVELRGQGRRLVAFRIGARPFLFDPNRIFSDQGIERTLRFHGHYALDAHAAVAGLRDAIIDALQLGRSKAIIALHNNGSGSYTLNSYLPGAEFAAEAAAVHLPATADPGDFFLVTQQSAYNALADSRFGVVLQHAEPDDDGSMSTRYQGPRPLYINVEARHGHRQQQRAMLQLLLSRMDRLI